MDVIRILSKISNMKKQFISWRRVSTFKQNRSGLGLEAQKEIIRYFVEREGGDLIADYSECYTGTELSGCVELRKAMEHCKKEGAILVIAKSDRFRNTIEALQVYEEMGDGNIMFCDLPHTDKFTLTLFFALAEREALIVSIRTKQALAAKKGRGEKLGGAADKWRESFENKTQEQKDKEHMKKGKTRNSRHLEDRSVSATFKVLRNVFPEATKDEDPAMWAWAKISCGYDNRMKILSMMKDYKSIDPTLFPKWNFDDMESNYTMHKLASWIQSLRKSAITRRENETK